MFGSRIPLASMQGLMGTPSTPTPMQPFPTGAGAPPSMGGPTMGAAPSPQSFQPPAPGTGLLGLVASLMQHHGPGSVIPGAGGPQPTAPNPSQAMMPR